MIEKNHKPETKPEKEKKSKIRNKENKIYTEKRRRNLTNNQNNKGKRDVKQAPKKWFAKRKEFNKYGWIKWKKRRVKKERNNK